MAGQPYPCRLVDGLDGLNVHVAAIVALGKKDLLHVGGMRANDEQQR